MLLPKLEGCGTPAVGDRSANSRIPLALIITLVLSVAPYGSRVVSAVTTTTKLAYTWSESGVVRGTLLYAITPKSLSPSFDLKTTFGPTHSMSSRRFVMDATGHVMRSQVPFWFPMAGTTIELHGYVATLTRNENNVRTYVFSPGVSGGTEHWTLGADGYLISAQVTLPDGTPAEYRRVPWTSQHDALASSARPVETSSSTADSPAAPTTQNADAEWTPCHGDSNNDGVTTDGWAFHQHEYYHDTTCTTIKVRSFSSSNALAPWSYTHVWESAYGSQKALPSSAYLRAEVYLDGESGGAQGCTNPHNPCGAICVGSSKLELIFEASNWGNLAGENRYVVSDYLIWDEGYAGDEFENVHYPLDLFFEGSNGVSWALYALATTDTRCPWPFGNNTVVGAVENGNDVPFDIRIDRVWGTALGLP